MKEEIAGIIQSALMDLFDAQPDILETTSATTMTEWNLAHHFSFVLSKYLFWYDHDNDVVKRNYQSQRPDVIFHKRTKQSNNFLVVEMKKEHLINDDDKTKIIEAWFSAPLMYQYGACISISNKNDFQILLIERSTNTEVTINNIDAREYNYYKFDDYDETRNTFRETMSRDETLDPHRIETVIRKYRNRI